MHDLALIELGAISMPFTDDFAGKVNQALLDKYNVALLLISKRDARLFPQKPAHVAFIDADNDGYRGPGPSAVRRCRTRPTSTAWSFRRARPAASRGW